VLVTGLGERAGNWSTTTKTSDASEAVFPSVATFSRVCAYDRPGTTAVDASGYDATRSTPVPQPTTVREDAADLNTLLKKSGERGPYVLVAIRSADPSSRSTPVSTASRSPASSSSTRCPRTSATDSHPSSWRASRC
jgi:hypothetical protein